MPLRQLAPRLILDSLAARRFHGRFTAVALFIDLSGFSALSDGLMQYGHEGVETLTGIINRIFDPIIEEVYARGGFVATFAGDAFTALFPLACDDAIQQAVVTAFAIQEMMTTQQRLQTRLGAFSLAVKVGLDVGEVSWGIVGEENARTYYFRGPAIDGSARAEALARPGWIVCGEGVWAAISGQVQGQPVAQKWQLLSHPFDLPRQAPQLPQLTQERLAPFVPDAILNLHIPAEFRNVCSVFIAFEEPESPAALEAFVSATMALARIYGGYFNKVDFGDKGNVMLVLFGAPISFENNTERAAEFLLALREQQDQLRWRAGVTFGPVYAGLVGGRARCEYTAIGDVVNLSSRLMTMADWGEILIDARAQTRLSGRYQLDFVGRRRVKGKRALIPIYRLAARRIHTTRPEASRPFFGREAELADLQAWLSPLWPADASMPPSACFIHIIGEAGIGKTRLLQALRAQLQRIHDFQWLRCPADAILRQSFNPFVYALRQYFAQSPDHPAAENRALFERTLAQLAAQLPQDERGEAVRKELQRTHAMLGALLDLHWEASLYEQLEPKLRFENTLLALINFFRALSLLRPLLLEIDGGHLLDADSCTLLQRMIIELKDWPVGVLVASRDEPGLEVTLPGAEEAIWQVVRLSPLSRQEAGALAASLLGAPLSVSAIRFLAEKTDGNPLFLEQLVQDLRERGAFVAASASPDTLTLAASELTDIPATIGALFVSRIDRLAPPLRNVEQTASVLGQEFETPVLALMTPQPDALPNLLRAAETERIWRALTEARYAFVQSLLRDVAYRMQMGERLRHLHRLAAAAYEKLYAAELPTRYADLAYHFEKGEQFQKAAYYLRQAAEQARENYQNEMALSFYERLLKYSQGQEQARIHEHRGDILHSTGAYDHALAAYRHALAIWQAAAGHDRRIADIQRKIASIYVDKGAYDTVQDWLDRAQAHLHEEDSPELARVLLLRAGVSYRRGEVRTALNQCQQALETAIRTEALPEQAHAHRLLGTIHTGAGDLAAAVRDYRASMALCQRLGDLRQQSMASNSLAAVYYYQGEWALAEQTYLQALEIATRIGFVDQQATISNNLGELYLLQGRFDDAEARFRASLDTWTRTGFLLGQALAHRNLAQIAINRAAWEQAAADLQQSLSALARLNSRGWLLAEVHRLLAEVQLAQGNAPEAWAHCYQALGIASEQDIKLVESNVRRTMGLLYRSEGQWEQAEAALQKSLTLARELGLRYEEGKAWQELALLYREYDPPYPARMTEAAAKALAIFADLGAQWDMSRVETLN